MIIDGTDFNVQSVMGLDLSLRNVGYAIFDFNKDKKVVDTIVNKAKDTEDVESLKAMLYIKEKVMELFVAYRPIIFLENYAFGKKKNTSSLTQIAEITGVVKLLAHELGLPIFTVASNTWKKFLKKGNIEKDMVPLEVLSIYKFKAKTTHEADAFVLGQVGLAYLDLKINKEALNIYIDRQIECVDILNLLR